MRRQVTITKKKIDEQRCTEERELDTRSGAVVCFLGIVRGTEGDERIKSLEYEAFEKMAYHQFNLILDQVQTQWPVRSVRLIHRIGIVEAGQPSLWIEVTAPHRKEAFEASEWLIDEMKRKVPIWKKPILK